MFFNKSAGLLTVVSQARYQRSNTYLKTNHWANREKQLCSEEHLKILSESFIAEEEAFCGAEMLTYDINIFFFVCVVSPQAPGF